MGKYIHHVCIQTNNYKDSLDFYTRIMGFKIEKETKNFHERDYNTWLKLGNFMIELQTPKKKGVFKEFSKKHEGLSHICFYVEDIDKEYKSIIARGWKDFVRKEEGHIYTVEGGKLFKIISPEGTIIEIKNTKGI